MDNTVNLLFKYLPLRISKAVHSMPEELFCRANEIRLRKNAPLSVTIGDKNIMIDADGIPCGEEKALRASESEIKECLSKLTEGSLYTCDEFISNGFIPLPEGGRAGVCGKGNYRGGRMIGFAEIYSVNLRLHRFLPYAAKPLLEEFAHKGITGTIVCSPPALGKTTFLRSIAYLLASGKGVRPKRVGIADERGELTSGMGSLGLADVITGVPKAHAMELLTRTMAPQIIICDEISPKETDAVLEAQNTGVTLIASAHCKTPNELLKRGRMKELLTAGIFQKSVILDYCGGYTCRIIETEDVLCNG